MRALALLFVLLAPAGAAAQGYGPDGFAFPRIGEGRSFAPGGELDLRAWSFSELGPEVCAGEAARVHLRLGGRQVSLPCAGFVHAIVDQGRAPKNWGRRADPIRALSVSAILARDPDVLLTWGERGVASKTWGRRVARALRSDLCRTFGADFLLCPQPDWKPDHVLLVSDREAEVLAGGARLAFDCEASGGRHYCRLTDWSGPDAGWQVEAAFDRLEPDLLDGFRTWSAAAQAMIEDWSAPR